MRVFSKQTASIHLEEEEKQDQELEKKKVKINFLVWSTKFIGYAMVTNH